jgi:deoxycytidylate deaminase
LLLLKSVENARGGRSGTQARDAAMVSRAGSELARPTRRREHHHAMKKKLDLDQFFVKSTEVVLGLVAPVGTDFDAFMKSLEIALAPYGYDLNEIRMSGLANSLAAVDPTTEERPSAPPLHERYFDRTMRLMTAGDNVRALHPEVLSLAAVEKVRQTRPSTVVGTSPRKIVHVVRSLKHPSEVYLLRRVYGPGFFLIGVITNRTERAAFLKQPPQLCKTAEIEQLFERDEHGSGQGGDGGQRTRETFQLADAFIRLTDTVSLQRFLALVFGTPHETPLRDEHAMFLAFSAALRSGDLSRQVGAVITSRSGDVVAIGTNDVPIAGGGLCWPGEFDHRDHSRAYRHDSNETRRAEIVQDVLERLREVVDAVLEERRPAGVAAESWRVDEATWRAEGGARLKDAKLKDITEYGRAVHAEMEALLSCARSGIPTTGATLYSTTFPCHNCAKHIVAAGIDRVVYIEPYPKSQAMPFYAESIVDGRTAGDLFVPSSTGEKPSRELHKVLFEPFVGVGPRRFFDLLSLGLSSGFVVERKQTGGMATTWAPSSAQPRVPLHPISFLQREEVARTLLLDLTKPEAHHENPGPKHSDP